MLTRRLCAACEGGNLQDVRGLIEQRGITPNYPSADADGRTPLHFAAEKLHADVVEYLLKHGASVHSSDRLGFTPLTRACLALANETDRDVLRRGARIATILRRYGSNFRTRDKFGNSIIHLLAAKANDVAFGFWSDLLAGSDDLVLAGEATIEDSKLSLFLLPGWGLMTPLHLASEAGNVAVVKYILDVMKENEQSGILVNVIDAIGWSPLHWAALRDDVTCCQELVKSGAFIHQRDYLSREPIDVALTFHSMEAARWLSAVISSSAKLEQSPRALHAVDTNHASTSEVSSSSAVTITEVTTSTETESSAHESTSESDTTASALSSLKADKKTIPTPTSRHHFVLISSSLALVICSAAEMALRSVSVIAGPSRYARLMDFLMFLGPPVLILVLLFASQCTPSNILPCLRRWKRDAKKSLVVLTDICICLFGLTPLKCGPLIIAHSMLLEERHHPVAGEKHNHTPRLTESSVDRYTSSVPRHPMRHKLGTPAAQTGQAMDTICYRLINEHHAPRHIMELREEEQFIPSHLPAVSQLGEVTEIRAELRHEWIPLYQPLVECITKLFQASNYKSDVPIDFVLIAMWIFQSLLTSSKARPSPGPISATSETVTGFTPAGAPSTSSWAVTEESWVSGSNVLVTESSSGESHQTIPVTDTLFPGMDAESRKVLMSNARHQAPRRIPTPRRNDTTTSQESSAPSSASPSTSSDDEVLSSDNSSVTDQRSSQEDTSEEASAQRSSSSAAASSSQNSPSTSSESDDSDGSRQTASEYTDPLSDLGHRTERSCQTSPFKQEALLASGARNYQPVTVSYGAQDLTAPLKFPVHPHQTGYSGKVLVDPEEAEMITVFNVGSLVYELQPHPATCFKIPSGTLIGNPLLNTFALRGLSRDCFIQSFVVWLREFQKMASFLKERPHLCVPLQELTAHASGSMTMSSIQKIFHSRNTAGPITLDSKVPISTDDSEKLSGSHLLDRLMSALRKESANFHDKQCIPPFIDLDVLSRETKRQTIVTTPVRETLQADSSSAASSVSISIDTEDESSSESAMSTPKSELKRTVAAHPDIPKNLQLSYITLVLLPCLVDLGFTTSYLVFYQHNSYLLPTLLGMELLFLLTFTIGCLFRC